MVADRLCSKRGSPLVERRTFLRHSLIGATSVGLGGFALGSLGFLWPRLGDVLTGEVVIGDADELVAQITEGRAPARVPAAGLSIVVWDPSSTAAPSNCGDDHRAIVDGTTALMALDSANCPHLGVWRAVVPDVAVVRVSVSRFALQPLGRVDRRSRTPAGSIAPRRSLTTPPTSSSST